MSSDDRPKYPVTRAWLERFLRWKTDGGHSYGAIARMTAERTFPFPAVSKQTVADICRGRRDESRDLPGLSHLAAIPCTEIVTPELAPFNGATDAKISRIRKSLERLDPDELENVARYIEFVRSQRES